MSTYSEKLKDPRWQKKRLKILERDHFRCMDCFSDEKTLHVHHLFYSKGLEPWEYNDQQLLTLCEHCHIRMEERQIVQCEELVNAFKSNLKTCFIRDCCVQLFQRSTKLHDLIFLLWELQKDQEDELINVLTEMYNSKKLVNG